MHNKRNLQEHISLKGYVANKTYTNSQSLPQNTMAETLVAAISNQLSNNILYIFTYCDLLVLNKHQIVTLKA